MPPEPVDERAVGRINLLLEEYRALRADLGHQTASHATLIGFVAAAAALVTDREDFTTGAWVWVVAAVVVIGLLYWGLSLPVRSRMKARVRELETALNDLAKTAYGATSVKGAELEWEKSRTKEGRAEKRRQATAADSSSGQPKS